MTMKLVDFDGEQAVFVRWRTSRPQKGDHMNIYNGIEGQPAQQVQRRLILNELLFSQISEIDKNINEEWWSFTEMSEQQFQKMRVSAIRSEAIAKTHDSLF